MPSPVVTACYGRSHRHLDVTHSGCAHAITKMDSNEARSQKEVPGPLTALGQVLDSGSHLLAGELVEKPAVPPAEGDVRVAVDK